MQLRLLSRVVFSDRADYSFEASIDRAIEINAIQKASARTPFFICHNGPSQLVIALARAITHRHVYRSEDLLIRRGALWTAATCRSVGVDLGRTIQDGQILSGGLGQMQPSYSCD